MRRTGSLKLRPYEADAVAVDAAGKAIAFGSCKWPGAGNEGHAHGAAELDKLETIRQELDAPDALLYFFDRASLSPRLQELAAERDDVRLVLAADLG